MAALAGEPAATGAGRTLPHSSLCMAGRTFCRYSAVPLGEGSQPNGDIDLGCVKVDYLVVVIATVDIGESVACSTTAAIGADSDVRTIGNVVTSEMDIV